MSTSQGLGRRRPPLCGFVPWARAFDYGTVGEQGAKAMADELYFGGYPPPVAEIPLSWISGQLRVRQANKFNRAEVSQSGGATARSTNLASPTDRQWTFTASVASIVDVDAANLAKWVTDYYDSPLPRSAALTLILNERAETEIWRILGVKQGQHISITDTPAGLPTGSTELLVEGISHQILADLRTVTWVTSPVIGATAGTPGPWARYDATRYSSSTEIRPF